MSHGRGWGFAYGFTQSTWLEDSCAGDLSQSCESGAWGLSEGWASGLVVRLPPLSTWPGETQGLHILLSVFGPTSVRLVVRAVIKAGAASHSLPGQDVICLDIPPGQGDLAGRAIRSYAVG